MCIISARKDHILMLKEPEVRDIFQQLLKHYNNNNDNEYLERLTRTGPKRLITRRAQHPARCAENPAFCTEKSSIMHRKTQHDAQTNLVCKEPGTMHRKF